MVVCFRNSKYEAMCMQFHSMDVLENLVFLSLVFTFQEDLELVQQIEKQSVYKWCFINSYMCMQPNVSTLKFTSKV